MSRRKVLGETHHLALRLPEVLHKAIENAAADDYVSDAEWIRRILIERLRADGRLPVSVNRPADDTDGAW